MKKQILFRKGLAEQGEYETASKFFDIIETRSQIEFGALVIPRYSSLPYFDELQKDVDNLGGTLINTFSQHRRVADMNNWVYLAKEMTPRTWSSPEEALRDTTYSGPYILKGETNSRKHLWKTHMFAQDKDAMRQVFNRLLDDSLLSSQQIFVREYEKFVSYDVENYGPPVSNEWRCFFYKGELLSVGFYWSNHLEEIREKTGGGPCLNSKGTDFLDEVGVWLKRKIDCPFVVADIAEHTDGRWRLVELNDGTMSGLSCVSPDHLYQKLASVLEQE